MRRGRAEALARRQNGDRAHMLPTSLIGGTVRVAENGNYAIARPKSGAVVVPPGWPLQNAGVKALLVIAPLLLATGLGQESTNQPTPASLRVRHELPLDGKPLGLAALDLDGDGNMELFAATKSPGAVYVLSGFERGVGSREANRVLPIGDYPVGPIVSNGEVVAGSRSNSELYWFDAKSLETLQPRLGIKLETAPRVLVSADVDRDGRDEVCVLTKENEIFIASEDGSVETSYTAHDQPCCGWALSDGRLVVGFQVGQEIAVYRRDPSHKAGWTTDWEVKFEGVPRAIREVDFDGDGDLELVVSGGDNLHWVLGLEGSNGARDWIEPAECKPKRIRWGAIPYALDAAENELFAMAYFEPAWSRFAGSPPKRVDGGYAGQAPVAIASADLDGDGRVDLAIANSEARRISVMFGGEDGKLRVAPQVATGRAPTELCVANVLGDSTPEVVSLNVLNNTFTVARWNGTAFETLQTASSGPEASGLALGDLNEDGRPDLIILRRNATEGIASVKYSFHDGVPFSIQGTHFNSSAPEYGKHVIGKSASDALVLEKRMAQGARLCVTDPVGNALHVLELKEVSSQNFNMFDLVLRPRSVLTLEGAPTALAPLDEHGVRVAVALAGPGPRTGVSIVGIFGEASELEFLPLTERPLDICTGDFDGDGRLDIGVLAFEGNRDGHAVFIPLLTRDKGFIPGPKQRTGLRAHSIISGDLNGDGLDDVLVSAQNSHHVNLWLSRKGSPVAFERQADLGLETGPLGLALADANGDGKLDLFVANAFANSVSLVLNETE